jgi:N-methylhydantoinase B
LDSLAIDIIHTRLVSSVDEAALTLHRTSFSTVVRDSHDYTCLLMDADGRGIAQATRSIPSFLGTLPVTVRAFLAKWGADGLAPGDVLATNDPWLGTGHLPDLTVAMPVFMDGTLVAFAGAIAHLPDIGGRRRAADSVDVFEEGLQIPPMKIKQAGAWNETLLELVSSNVRVPGEVIGDIHAMVGACEKLARDTLGLLRHYALAGLSPIADSVISRTDRAMRQMIATLPRGVFRSETPVEQMDGSTRTIRCAVTIAQDGIDIDFAGSSPQATGSLNSPLLYTQAYALYAVKALLLPHASNNDGTGASIRVHAPPGTMLSAQRPSAVEARAAVGHFVPTAVLNALAQALPGRVPAESTAPVQGIGLRGTSKGRPFAGLVFFSGGQGGHAKGDGSPCLTFPTNVSCTPTEVLEEKYPVLVLEKSLVADSGGPGRHRGGLGQRIRLRSTCDADMMVTLLASRTRTPAQGRDGGAPGRPERILLNGEPVSVHKALVMRRDDVLTLECPGGGGFGAATDRAPEAVERDIRDGYVTTPAFARTTGDPELFTLA